MIKNYLFYEERTKSYVSCCHRRKSCVLFTYGFNMERKNIKEKSVGESEAWKQVSSSSILLRMFQCKLTHQVKAMQQADLWMKNVFQVRKT